MYLLWRFVSWASVIVLSCLQDFFILPCAGVGAMFDIVMANTTFSPYYMRCILLPGFSSVILCGHCITALLWVPGKNPLPQVSHAPSSHLSSSSFPPPTSLPFNAYHAPSHPHHILKIIATCTSNHRRRHQTGHHYNHHHHKNSSGQEPDPQCNYSMLLLHTCY